MDCMHPVYPTIGFFLFLISIMGSYNNSNHYNIHASIIEIINSQLHFFRVSIVRARVVLSLVFFSYYVFMEFLLHESYWQFSLSRSFLLLLFFMFRIFKDKMLNLPLGELALVLLTQKGTTSEAFSCLK